MSGALGVQDAAVVLIALGAIGWLTRRWWRRRRRGTCTCDGCPVAEKAMAAPDPAAATPGDGARLISIEGPGPRGA